MDERDGNDSETEWEELGVHDWAVNQWQGAGITPFEAAIAQGDGFSPLFAAHYRRSLRKSADAWIRAGIEPFQALQSHRRGLTAKQVAKQRLDTSNLTPSSQHFATQVL